MGTTTNPLAPGGYSSYRDYLEEAKYHDDASTSGTSGTKGAKWNAVFTDESTNTLDMDGFLKVMIAQLTNQDFMNPTDDTQFVTQMAQFSMMQSMSDLTANFKNNYMLSLVGQTVTCAKFNVSGDLIKETGVVERIILADNDYSIYVNGEKFTLSQIMELGEAKKTDTDTSGSSDEADGADTSGTEGAGETDEA